MYIKDINITNFRNYDKLSLKFEKGINIIYGNNGQGKTNLLESLYFLALTKSHRSYIDSNIIKKNSEFSKIIGNIYINNIKSKLEININEKNKILKIDNNIIKKTSDYISKLNIIIFYPEDLELIKGSPSIRRRFLNLELSQLYSEYFILINDYNKILKMRNDYLKKSNNFDKNYFDIITNYLIDKSINIYILRNRFINKINENVKNIYKDLTKIDGFNIKYKNSIKFDNFDKNHLKNILKNEYEKIYLKELKYKSTLIGPHRDDFELYINDMEIKNYGSQGQQRSAILAIKLSEIDILKKYTGSYPILLLDDVFSELDKIKKNNLLKYIDNDIQVLITTTDLSNLNRKLIKKSKLIQIDNGKIKKIVEVS